ncbi:MAG: tail fiber domain-containing protein, partial [Cytophagia bacterium]|nr:tail fiber domain-containing protein [Cytophagia bacterium]
WVTDKRPNGQLELWGPESQNFYLGARVWEEGGADRGIFQVFGNNEETPQGSGNFSSFEAAVISVQDFGDGAQQGLLQLGKAGANPTILNYDNLSKLVSSVDGNGKYRFEVNAQNSGVLKLMSSVDSVNVLIDSNGPKAGLIYLNDSLGRPNYKMVTYSGGSAYMEMSAGIPDIGESRIVYQHAGYMNPWTNMIARNADGTAKGRVQSGWLSGGGEDFGQFRVSASNNRTLASMGGNETVGGAITLEGPNSPLIHMGSLNWEDNDGPERARISMFGNGSEDDGNGGTYTPERVSLTVGKDAANSEFGTLNLSNSAGGGFEVGSRVWENDNQGGLRSFTALKGTQDVDDGNGGTYRPWLVSQEIQDDGNGEYGTLNVNGTNGSSINLIGGSGDINISGVVNQSSDARLKKNVTTLTSGLSMVNRLRGVRYNWKDESKPEAKIGFIAQEVEEVLPELVKTREDGFKGINYAEMTAVLVEAVKELSAQVEALKAENSTLKAEATKVEAMEDRLAKIEALLLNNQKVNANQK